MKRTRKPSKNTLAEENKLLAYDLAWSFHRSTGIECEELVSEALLALATAMETYDSRQSSFSTWAYVNIKNRLLYVCKRERRRKEFIVPFDSNDNMAKVAPTITLNTKMGFVNEDVLCVVKTILDNMVPICKAHHKTRPIILRKLLEDAKLSYTVKEAADLVLSALAT